MGGVDLTPGPLSVKIRTHFLCPGCKIVSSKINVWIMEVIVDGNFDHFLTARKKIGLLKKEVKFMTAMIYSKADQIIEIYPDVRTYLGVTI